VAALDKEDFTCVFPEWEIAQEFRKVGSTGVLLVKSVGDGVVSNREFFCNSGNKADYGRILLCVHKEEYVGVATTVAHLVLYDGFARAMWSTSSFSYAGEIQEFGSGALVSTAMCR